MTGQTKTTTANQPGPTRAPLEDQPEGSPETVDKDLEKSGTRDPGGAQKGDKSPKG
jgi:hypothetical protein